MEITIEPGTYVVAVSGGVDSIVLLDLLRRQPGLRLIVAHLDHGIREDSDEDRLLVQQYAEKHGLPFVFHKEELGQSVSEAKARQIRYDFLRKVQQAANADAIVTAHHQDDRLETAVHNMLRGTGRKGLSSLDETTDIKRPLLHLSKDELKQYAQSQGLSWREDSTNADTKYKRNYIRHKLLPKLDKRQKQQLLDNIEATRSINKKIDAELQAHLSSQPGTTELDRAWFISLPHQVAKEIMAEWLRRQGIANFDKQLVEGLVVAAKTYRQGKAASVTKDYNLKVRGKVLALVKRDR